MAQMKSIIQVMCEGKNEVLNRLISAEFTQIVNQPDFKVSQIINQ